MDRLAVAKLSGRRSPWIAIEVIIQLKYRKSRQPTAP
jgi:hypothetical protein